MSIYCPSCGAAVAADATTCPVCGEPLEPVAGTTATSAGTSSSASAGKVNCPECGAVNSATAAECASCGAPLGPARKAKASARTGRLTTGGTSATTFYLIGFVALVIIGAAIFLLSTPAEKTGPPEAAQQGTQEGLPKGHPPIDDAKAREAITKKINELNEQVAADPGNATLQLELANALYDGERHAEALPHYKAYLDKNQNDLDAKTDFATSLAQAGKVDTAIIVLNSVLATDQKHQRAAFNMAIMYKQKDNRDSVVYWLRKVAAIDSTSPPGKAAVDILESYKKEHP